MTNIQPGVIRYNASAGAFEARVDVHRGGHVYGYPCAVDAPMTMAQGEVRARLIAQAERQSTGRGGLRSVL